MVEGNIITYGEIKINKETIKEKVIRENLECGIFICSDGVLSDE